MLLWPFECGRLQQPGISCEVQRLLGWLWSAIKNLDRATLQINALHCVSFVRSGKNDKLQLGAESKRKVSALRGVRVNHNVQEPRLKRELMAWTCTCQPLNSFRQLGKFCKFAQMSSEGIEKNSSSWLLWWLACSIGGHYHHQQERTLDGT